jgi:hypothetical protein
MFKVFVVLTLLFALTFATETPKSLPCSLCVNGAAIMKDYLTHTDEHLIGMLFNLCGLIPTQFQTQCKGAVAAMGKQFITLLRQNFNDSPREICEGFGACPRTKFSLVSASNDKFMQKVSDFINKKAQCNLDELREFYYWLPPSAQREIKRQLIDQIYGQFPRLRIEVVEKLVSDMFDKNIPQQRVCDDLDRILIPEARRRQECQEECINKIDLSLPRLIRVINECRLQINCYMNEIARELQNVQRCAHECYMKPDEKMIL